MVVRMSHDLGSSRTVVVPVISALHEIIACARIIHRRTAAVVVRQTLGEKVGISGV